MLIQETGLAGVRVIEIEKKSDERGYFARTFCEEEFGAAGLVTRFVQSSQSHNRRRGTVRGMHFQRPPHAEVKVVRVVRGAVWDVIIDLRKELPSYGRWEGFDLSAENGRILYIPEGFAHGFQTLEDDTDVIYQNLAPPYAGDGRGGAVGRSGLRDHLAAGGLGDRSEGYGVAGCGLGGGSI